MTVAGEYSDENFSGKNIPGRQEFQRMLNDIQDGKDTVSYVLVFELSRFGRNAADVLNSLQPMQDYGVKEFMKAFIARIGLFPEKRKDGSWIKNIVFNFPVPVDGEEVKELPLKSETAVETIVLMSRAQIQQSRQHKYSIARRKRTLLRDDPTQETKMRFPNVYFINGTAYAGKSTMVKLLAEKYGGMACEENYHDCMAADLDPKEFPNLTYPRDLQNWSDFIRRTPDAYEAWVDGVTTECAALELKILEKLSRTGQKIFVDTNIPVDMLHEISDENHVLIMLADPDISVNRFFDRPDREKQFLYQLLLREDDPQAAMENFRNCLRRVNSRERYAAFYNAGFPVILRDDSRSIEETLKLAEQAFRL